MPVDELDRRHRLPARLLVSARTALALDPVARISRPTLGPLIDPNEHSCGTVRPHGERELPHPEPGVYIAGMKIAMDARRHF